jgi:hypothetical protein
MLQITIERRLRLFTCFINKYLIEETTALKVLTEPLTTMAGSSQILYDRKTILFFVDTYNEG